jgi:hypothetical protein
MINIKFRSAHYNLDGTFNGFTYWGKIDQYGNTSDDTFCSPTSRSGTTRVVDEMFIRKLKNEKELYEGDIVSVRGRKKIGIYQTSVVFKNQGFQLEVNDTYLNDSASLTAILDVISTIHESK